MKSRKKNILYTILIWVVILVGAYMYAHIDKMHTLYDEDVDTSSYIATGDLSKGVLEQTFLCKEDSLDGMSVKCQLFGDVTGIKLKYQLSEAGSDTVVAEGNMAAEKIKNNQFTKCFFNKKITGCSNKQYVFKIMQDNASEQQGVGFCYENQVKEKSNLSISGEDTEGTLIAKTITKRFDLETFIVVVCFIAFIWAFFKVLYKLFK